MRKRMAKLFKKVEWGDHDAMMEAIELLIDTMNEIPFDMGYRSCLDDMNVRSYRLAEHINKCSNAPLKVDELAKTIENYFNDVLKDE